ncbi:DUF2169 family type VI secretion system accessory protein [Hyalangium gracile]|uniref:DUF2169 family type VI secretion system accessory protein n=1 Tax=Hyalangium gracile TaxID=394092 RepID=UPI001CCC33F1|nr:DUF2169 domain-containing protein [Hyalangium gracile]
MNLPELNTRTDATVELLPKFGLDGAPCYVVVIKQRFSVQPMGAVRRETGAKVRLVDEPWDPDVPESSIRYPSDACLRKPSTDVVVVGSAVAVDAQPVTELDVRVQVGPVSKQLKVFGLRVWFKGALGMTLTPPKPFQSLPLRWEYAYGGMDTSNPKELAHEPRNPVGRGVVADSDSLLHKPGPQIEDPDDLIRGARSRPAPAGVGPIGPGVEPRLRYAGTYDDRWQKERMPLPPLDFDERHNQVAAPGLICPSYLRGGEPVLLVGLHEDGPLEFELPRLAFYVGSQTVDGTQEHRPVLDTVLLEPNERRFELTWRSLVPVPKWARELKSITVFEKEFLG